MKSILCIITLFAACVGTVFAHGDGRCVRYADGTLARISHFAPSTADDPSPDADFLGGHGHIKSIGGIVQSRGYWTPGGYAYVQARIDGGYWDESKIFTDCTPQRNTNRSTQPRHIDTTPDVVRDIPTPKPPIVVVSSPADNIIEDIVPPTPLREPEIVVLPPVIITETLAYTMTFPQGVSALHLPFPSARARRFTDLYYFLGDDNVHFLAALRPTVQLWTVVRSVDSRVDEWISPYRGFVANMQTEVTLELALDNPRYSYTVMYLKTGYNLIGVPRRSPVLETVADFFDVFPTVESVKGLDPDIEVGIDDTPSVGWFIDLDGDTEIDCCTAYLIYSNDDAQYAVWGFPWHYEPSSAAPGIWRVGKLAVTWGGLKSGRQ